MGPLSCCFGGDRDVITTASGTEYKSAGLNQAIDVNTPPPSRKWMLGSKGKTGAQRKIGKVALADMPEATNGPQSNRAVSYFEPLHPLDKNLRQDAPGARRPDNQQVGPRVSTGKGPNSEEYHPVEAFLPAHSPVQSPLGRGRAPFPQRGSKRHAGEDMTAASINSPLRSDYERSSSRDGPQRLTAGGGKWHGPAGQPDTPLAHTGSMGTGKGSWVDPIDDGGSYQQEGAGLGSKRGSPASSPQQANRARSARGFAAEPAAGDDCKAFSDDGSDLELIPTGAADEDQVVELQGGGSMEDRPSSSGRARLSPLGGADNMRRSGNGQAQRWGGPVPSAPAGGTAAGQSLVRRATTNATMQRAAEQPGGIPVPGALVDPESGTDQLAAVEDFDSMTMTSSVHCGAEGRGPGSDTAGCGQRSQPSVANSNGQQYDRRTALSKLEMLRAQAAARNAVCTSGTRLSPTSSATNLLKGGASERSLGAGSRTDAQAAQRPGSPLSPPCKASSLRAIPRQSINGTHEPEPLMPLPRMPDAPAQQQPQPQAPHQQHPGPPAGAAGTPPYGRQRYTSEVGSGAYGALPRDGRGSGPGGGAGPPAAEDSSVASIALGQGSPGNGSWQQQQQQRPGPYRPGSLGSSLTNASGGSRMAAPPMGGGADKPMNSLEQAVLSRLMIPSPSSRQAAVRVPEPIDEEEDGEEEDDEELEPLQPPSAAPVTPAPTPPQPAYSRQQHQHLRVSAPALLSEQDARAGQNCSPKTMMEHLLAASAALDALEADTFEMPAARGASGAEPAAPPPTYRPQQAYAVQAQPPLQQGGGPRLMLGAAPVGSQPDSPALFSQPLTPPLALSSAARQPQPPDMPAVQQQYTQRGAPGGANFPNMYGRRATEADSRDDSGRWPGQAGFDTERPPRTSRNGAALGAGGGANVYHNALYNDAAPPAPVPAPPPTLPAPPARVSATGGPAPESAGRRRIFANASGQAPTQAFVYGPYGFLPVEPVRASGPTLRKDTLEAAAVQGHEQAGQRHHVPVMDEPLPATEVDMDQEEWNRVKASAQNKVSQWLASQS